MTEADIIEIKELLSTPQKIVITTHSFPDGDAMGSSLGLYNFLIQGEHDVTVVVPTRYPHFLSWMPGDDKVVVYSMNKEKAEQLLNDATVIFCNDFNTSSRVGEEEEALLAANAVKILIDHHPNPDLPVKYMMSVTEASSTAELIYEFIEKLGDTDKINVAVAESIYTGILTDTGSFSYGSTSQRAHQVAGEMINKGADNLKIQGYIYQDNSLNRVQLLGYSLVEKLALFPEYGAGYISLSKEDLKKYNFQPGDTEGLVNYITNIRGINFATFIMERNGFVKLSFRSTGNFSANEFARDNFNGGGHEAAAGGEFNGTLQEAIEKVVSLFPSYKDKLLS
ncbi:MAG: DHH family phosphoesterase [Bacteroidetes bacterium]|nr:MAG: DHH family phosphoesterase [Bacteroidota bacterium]